MAQVGNPFDINIPRNLNNDELIQALRLDIINEHEAIIGYESHAAATTDERVKKMLTHIADQEKSHIGVLEQLVFMLEPKDYENFQKGVQSVQKQQSQNFQAPLQS